MADELKEGGPAPEEPGRHGPKTGKMFEQDANDIPQKAQPQIPDVNAHTVQKGHRDREEV